MLRKLVDVFFLAICLGIRFSKIKQCNNKMVLFISLSSTLGIAISVSLIIVVLSVMNGFEYELKNRILSVIPHGEFEGFGKPIADWASLLEQLKKQKRVERAVPYIRLTALAEKGSQIKTLEIRGVTSLLEESGFRFAGFIQAGVLDSFHSDFQQIILGKGVADSIGIVKGEYLTLIIPTVNFITKVRAVKRVRVRVVGLFESHGQFDYSLALIPLKDAQKYASLGNSITGVAIKVDDMFDVTRIVSEMNGLIDFDLYFSSWEKKFGFLYRDIQLIRTIMYLIMVLLIGVASFNIVSTLMIRVKERLDEVAILKTLGATDAFIKSIFVYQGVFSGILGSALGSFFGVIIAMHFTLIIEGLESLFENKFLSKDVYFIDFLPSQINIFDVFLVFCTAVVLSLLATYFPAIKASRLSPASVLSSK
ncbi:lipoprotein-releasing system transmembrane protein [Candidatus Photodesmus blepharus]|uniref:Lipoprotein-releasing system transmembrane protein n=1 Tax=Candidatus Photodesmus blepharonis TaxID=1179155 RepID=A0A084CML7_9GAMM|nr:lipoprotein-releasing ABC transporter permease subunit LolE [Candidatus Photodesmus blepharus]KEY91046.1 lipoprotein-releasing system transmembrane protein [Candidatus Photodesmus blepharus]